MKEVFVDTFHFLALLCCSDDFHTQAKKAARLARQQGAKLVTTAWVLTELGNALAKPADRVLFLKVLAGLHQDPQTLIVPPTQLLFKRGVARYAGRPDKEWSLTDCISFVVMEDQGIKHVLTGDRHFAQAGFTVLFK